MKVITEDGEIIDTNCEECTVFFKTPYNHDRDAESLRTALTCEDRSLTDQSFKDDADINVIMDRARKGQLIAPTLPEHFGNAFDIPTLLEARTRIAENNAVFYNLEPRIREEFLNDPARWEAQVVKDIQAGNLDNLERMGIDIGNTRERLVEVQKAEAERQHTEDEKQLKELEERLAKRAEGRQAGSPAPAAPGEAPGGKGPQGAS